MILSSPALITLPNSPSFDSFVLFDTGTSGYSYLEDSQWQGNQTQLPLGSAVSLVTSGFNYSYKVGTIDNLTLVENPSASGGTFSDMSIEFFLTNEYMLDLSHNVLGLKNN